MISIKKGDTFQYAGIAEIAFTDVSSGRAVKTRTTDLTGYSGSFRIRRTNGQLVAEPAFEWFDASVGAYRVTADTTDWPVGAHLFDLTLTAPDGAVVSSETGNITVKGQI